MSADQRSHPWGDSTPGEPWDDLEHRLEDLRRAGVQRVDLEEETSRGWVFRVGGSISSMEKFLRSGRCSGKFRLRSADPIDAVVPKSHSAGAA